MLSSMTRIVVASGPARRCTCSSSCTLAMTYALSYGLPTYSSAPVCSPRIRSLTSASEDSITTIGAGAAGAAAPATRISCSSSTPSPSGSRTSSTIALGSPRAIASRAAAAVEH
jgi:hypothetical protein